ncbi:hypothetical protein Pmani_029819 [Petrolisthes manimaculis]|uniref:F-box only protein 9 n=1 Tax=Petrolisthes manimaculis TaxID=1843537 RepID=A0AAE1NY10_9EUCA|nr:hypothetical protein Pmani_029819 [Petrolisthes manimaculis]
MADTPKAAGADDEIALGDITEQNESTSQDQKEDPEAVLASFRKEWQRELEGSSAQKGNVHPTVRSPPLVPPIPSRGSPRIAKVTPQPEPPVTSANTSTGYTYDGGSHSTTPTVEDDVQPDIVIKATELFNKAVELEQTRRLYEAIQFYRRAMTLVPDIEFRVHLQNVDRSEGYRNGGLVVETEDQNTEDNLDQEELQDLVMRFQVLLASSPALCTPQYDQEAAHISCLPPEMLERIMHWVVGSDLDLRSLEQVSRVCHGFYLLARNPEIWHKACLRVWGVSCGMPGTYGSWREMFVHKPRPRYNGCYIARTTYFRPGETSYQDQNYHPWHVVQYYRYFRFFPDGIVSMLTSTDEPTTVLTQLRTREVRNSQILQGRYHIHGTNMSLVFKRHVRDRLVTQRKGRRFIGRTTDVAETIFQIELEIRALKRRPHWLLVWRKYSIVSVDFDNKQNISQIDVNDTNKFPNLAFSRVKSYTGSSEFPLI